MSEITVAECESAADVLRLAKQRAAWRRQGYERQSCPSESVQIIAEQPIPLVTIGGSPLKSDLTIVMEYARQISDMNRPGVIPRRPSIQRIVKETAAHFHLSVYDIHSVRRTWDVVLPRQVAMYLAKALTLRSLPEIGRKIGDRDHTTVLHAVRKIKSLIASGDTEVCEDIRTITTKLEVIR